MKIRLLTIALAFFAITAINSCTNNSNTADAVLENIYNRKSVRQFTSEPVSDEHIQTMLKAAMAAGLFCSHTEPSPCSRSSRTRSGMDRRIS